MALVWSDVNPEFRNASTKDIKLLGVNSIHNSIRNILLIQQGERFGFSAFGSNIEQFLFKNADPVNGQSLMNHIVNVVGRWERRIRIIPRESVITILTSENAYRILLVYTIVSDASRAEFTEVLKAGQGV